MIGAAITKDTMVASATPRMIRRILSVGAIAKNAMMEPGEEGPFRPQPVSMKNAMAHMFPTIGAMMTTGFISMYGK